MKLSTFSSLSLGSAVAGASSLQARGRFHFNHSSVSATDLGLETDMVQ